MTDKDYWKGEHLIRARAKTETDNAHGLSHGGSMVKRAKPVTLSGPRTCAVPGCGAQIGVRNRTGVCPPHCHSPRYCGCVKCTAKRMLK